MKPQNMKLLDLQTGKYLELEKDFYYGGDAIMIHCYTEEELTDYEELPDFEPNQHIRYYDYNDNTKYKKTLKNGFDEVIDSDTATVKLWIEYKSEPPLELKPLCDKIGAVVYGGRYLLQQDTIYICEYEIIYKITYQHYINAEIPRNFEFTPHIFANVKQLEPQYFSNKFICKNEDYLRTIKKYHEIQEFDSNTKIDILKKHCCSQVDILQEYSKQLRKEENNFDELKELLK